MPRGKRLTPDQQAQIMELNSRGVTDTQIAKILSMPLSTVYVCRVRMGGKPVNARRMAKTDPEEHNRRLELAKRGLTPREVAKKVGRSEQSIRVWFNANGFETNPHSRPIREQSGIHFSEALQPHQIPEMAAFLRTLSTAGRKAVKAGVKPDITGFMDEWRRSGHELKEVVQC